MKKNGKRIFVFIFAVILLFISLFTVSMYDLAVEMNKKKYSDVVSSFQDDFRYYTLSLAQQLDPSFEIFSFGNDVPETVKTKISNSFAEEAASSQAFLLADDGFFYTARNLSAGNIMSNVSKDNEQNDTEQYACYIEISYDENGNCNVSDDYYQQIFADFTLNELLGDEYAQYDVTVNKPRQIAIQFMLTAMPSSYNGISGYVHSWQRFASFTILTLCVGTIILALFFLLYPVRYVAEVNPFKTIRNWCFEINFCFLVTVISLSFLSCLFVSGYTMNGYFLQLFQNFGIDCSQQILLVINVLVWLIGFLMISLGLFECKYILAYGPWSFFKDHTLIASFFRMIKHQSNALLDVQINTPLQKTILKYVVINGCVAVFIGIFDFYLGIIFTIIYSFLIFRSISKQSNKIQNDYQKMMNSIHHLISEDFSQNIQEDLGVFEVSRRELEQLSTQFENALQEKVKSEKLKTELISNVSHDLKTPLTCIRNYIEVLNDDQLTIEKRHEYLNKVKIYANRLKTLIEDLLEISKVESGNIQLELADLNIGDLIEQVYMQSEEFFAEKDLTVIRKYPENKIVLQLDSQKTYRIFENLLMNISKYALPHSRAYVTVKDEEHDVKIIITNISEVAMDFTSEEIMERFVRGDKSRSKQGSGLGLAIARSFTEVQGGEFSLDIDCDVFKVIINFPKITE